MILSLKEFAEACNAIKVCGKAATDENKSAAPSVANLLFDSRRLNTTEDTVFFAIKTEVTPCRGGGVLKCLLS